MSRRAPVPLVLQLALTATGFVVVQTAGAQLTLTILQSFTSGRDGQQPGGTLVQATNGIFYGTTVMGGSNRAGTVFKLDPEGSGYVTIYHFPKSPSGPFGLSDPSGLIQSTDGALYGCSGKGGNGSGSIFRINLDGTGYTNIHVFNSSSDGAYSPSGGLVQGSDGKLYGTTMFGGAYGLGTVFKVGLNGDGFVKLRSLGGPFDAQQPSAPLIQGHDGYLYGTTKLGGSTAVGGVSGFGTIFRISTDGTDETIRHHFRPVPMDGHYPHAELVQSADGTLFGVTLEGGSTINVDGNGYGTIFKINPDGSGFSILHNFDPTVGNDGKYPRRGLVIGSDGALYGTCSGGGSGTMPNPNYGSGVVFRINQDGSDYRKVYDFGGSAADGYSPGSPLVRASNGVLFGTTLFGGANDGGVLFRLAPSPAILSMLRPVRDSQFQFAVTSAPYYDYRLEASTDLVHWVVFTNLFSSNATMIVTDPNAPKFPQRFYRATWLP